MAKAITNKVREWGAKQKVPPSLIIAHYINKGDQFWSQLTEEELETQLKKLYAEEKKEEEEVKTGVRHAIKMITVSFTKILSRGAYELAHLDYSLKCEIIKKYI
jgi:late competence protein required for DNA uptake (superfamily II DNA/RNA helicase)